MTDTTQEGALSRTARVLALTVVLGAGGAAAAGLPRPSLLADLELLSWWWLALLFALAQVSVIHVSVRRESLSLALGEIPLVMGLFLARPGDLVLARTVGCAAVFLVLNRQTPLKAAFNTALETAAAGVAVAVFTLTLTGARALDGPSWLAAVAAASTAGVLEAVCITWVVSWYGDAVRARDLAKEVLTSVFSSGLIAVVGTVVVLAFTAGGSWIPLLITGGAALLGYRAYAELARRYARLERLHRLSGRLAGQTTTAGVIEQVLVETAELMRAGYVELVLSRDRDATWTQWCRRVGCTPLGPRPYRDRLPPRTASHLDATTRVGRELLSPREVDDAVVVWLQVDETTPGFLLAADRAGEERGFGPDDLRLLQTVADQSSVALRGARLVDRLHHEARHDELTGLPNRLTFREALDDAAAAAAAGRCWAAVMLLDVDGFKAVNDTLGHHAGDELLQELARRMGAVTGGQALVARLGGDEFAVLWTSRPVPAAAVAPGAGPAEGPDAGAAAAPAAASAAAAAGVEPVRGAAVGATPVGGTADPGTPGDGTVARERALELAERLLGCFEEPVSVTGSRVRLGGSLGVAIGPVHGATASDLLRNADIAMYAVKAAGGGVRLFGPNLVADDVAAVTLAGDLRDAIAARDIAIDVQPVVDLRTGAVQSVEVLARWRHPERGDVPPEVFFASAERSGQTAELSALVLDLALQACRAWQALGRSIRVAVNVAPRSLADAQLPERVAGALARLGVPAELLCLEITEAGVFAEPEQALESLGRLRAMGVRLSVDDFGTGYSSLTYLSRLPVHQLKIDQSFVARLGESANDRAVVRSILDLGRNLGLDVVAEGVGDAGARTALLDLGCRLGQGYLFGLPMPPDRLPGYLDHPSWPPRYPSAPRGTSSRLPS